MKRDMDLIRKILTEIESCENVTFLGELHIIGYDNPTVAYHICLLEEAGYLKAGISRSAAGLSAIPNRLTWKGHEFLDAIKNDTVWCHVKSEIKRKLVSAPVEMIYNLSIQSLAQLLANGSL